MKILEYIKGAKSELKYVNWPARRQVVLFTILVIIISFIIAYFLGFFDFIFSLGIEQII